MWGPKPTTGLVRFLIVAEVTEMFMASQRKQWLGDTHATGADEGSMGESLSRFLSSQFLSVTGISKSIFPGFSVVPLWLNDPQRPNFVDVAPDDIDPDATTGCGTCFIFPVANLGAFSAPPLISWVFNDTPNIARVILDHPVAAGADIMLASDDATAIDLPTTIMLGDSGFVPLDVKTQAPGFSAADVKLTASYAGKDIVAQVTVVPPGELPVAPLVIEPLVDNDPCAQPFVAGGSQEFIVKNPRVLLDQHGLTYMWSVTGAVAQSTTTPTLTIASLPAPGTVVTVSVTLTNAFGIRAKGALQFTTEQQRTGLKEELRRLNCSLSRLNAINERSSQAPVGSASCSGS